MSDTTCGQLHQRPLTSASNYNRITTVSLYILLCTAGVLVGLLVTMCLVVVGLRVYRMRDLSLAQLTASSSNILQLSPPPVRSVQGISGVILSVYFCHSYAEVNPLKGRDDTIGRPSPQTMA